MENPTKDMILFHEVLYLGEWIYCWRGKYSRKNEKLYSIGNMYFSTVDKAKQEIDEVAIVDTRDRNSKYNIATARFS